jgi:hypothetical protein
LTSRRKKLAVKKDVVRKLTGKELDRVKGGHAPTRTCPTDDMCATRLTAKQSGGCA